MKGVPLLLCTLLGLPELFWVFPPDLFYTRMSLNSVTEFWLLSPSRAQDPVGCSPSQGPSSPFLSHCASHTQLSAPVTDASNEEESAARSQKG